MSRWPPHLRSTGQHNGRAEQVQLPTDPDAKTTAPPRVRPRAPFEGRMPKQAGARRLGGPLPWIGAALVLLALIGYIAVYAAGAKRTSVLVTTQTLQPGSVLSASDLRTAQLSGDQGVISGLEPAGALSQVVGQRVTVGLPAGTPLTRSALSTESSSGAQLTLAVPALHALGGALQPGDRVTVLATFGTGTGQAHTRAVARDLQVLAVGTVQTGEQPSTATVPVTVALASPRESSALALASEDGKIDLLRESANGSSAGIPEADETGSGP